MIEDAQFSGPVTDDELRALIAALNIELPKPLLELYSETNGVKGCYYAYIWSTERLIKENLSVWHRKDFEHKKPDNLLFFADAGNGDLFGLLVNASSEQVYVWNHENG